MNIEFYWVAVVLTTIVSASRLTRLATWDKFPPTLWLREKYADIVDGSGYELLVYCGYCASFWITGLIVGWGLRAGAYDFHTRASSPALVWWVVNGILAASYLAAILMAHDGDDGDED